MANGQEPKATQNPKRGMEEGRIGEVRLHRHPGGANGATPKHGALACHKYGLLGPEERVGDPTTAETQGIRDSTEDTSEIGRIYGRGTGTGELNGQRALLACGQKEGKDEERGPLNGSARLTHAARKGGKGGTPNQQCVPPAYG